MTSYLFYDIETTGLNKCFDQVLQFAAIRTDLQFKEQSRHEIRVKLNPDVIPHPRALLTHEIGLKDHKNALSELEAVTQIHHLMNKAGTISLGYNTLGFDDEFLRFSFYRNLLSPYSHQYANGCQRMDIYPITTLFYLFKPEIMKWPQQNNAPSLRLELINSENDFVTGRAHDAMVDVEITIALAKRLANETAMWHYAKEAFLRNKGNTVKIRRMSERSDAIFPSVFDTYQPALIIDGSFGSRQNYQIPVLLLGQHHHYKNQTICLRLDTPQLPLTTLDSIADNTCIIRRKTAEPKFLLPLSRHYTRFLDQNRLELCENNKQWLQKNENIVEAIVNYHLNDTYPNIPQLDANAALYQHGFWQTAEKQFCRQFHQAKTSEQSQMIENIQQPLLRELALRVLGRSNYDALNFSQQQQFDTYLQRVFSDAPLTDYRGKNHYDTHTALQDIAEIEMGDDALSSRQQQLLAELTQYITTKKSWY